MKKDLSKEQIRDIIRMKAEGFSIPEIMKKYPAIKTRSTIYYHLYKAPPEKQNTLNLLHKKLDAILQKLQDIENELLKSTQDQANQKKVQNNVQEVKALQGEIYIKTAEIIKLCWYEADGKNPEICSIQKYFRSIGLTSDDPTRKGYLLSDVIEALQQKNNKPRASKLNISGFLKLQENANKC